MEYQSLFGFYWFGTCLRYLQDATVGFQVHGHGTVTWNIDELFSNLSAFKLPVTERLAHERLDSFVEALKALPPDSRLTTEQATTLRDVIVRLRDTLEAEIQGVGAYTPTPKRLDLTRLLGDVTSLFAPDTFNALPPISQYDFGEAGKCIAFERSTAAAFTFCAERRAFCGTTTSGWCDTVRFLT